MGGCDGCRPPGPSRDRRSEAEAGSEQGAIYALEVAWRQWLSPTTRNQPLNPARKMERTGKIGRLPGKVCALGHFCDVTATPRHHPRVPHPKSLQHPDDLGADRHHQQELCCDGVIRASDWREGRGERGEDPSPHPVASSRSAGQARRHPLPSPFSPLPITGHRP